MHVHAYHARRGAKVGLLPCMCMHTMPDEAPRWGCCHACACIPCPTRRQGGAAAMHVHAYLARRGANVGLLPCMCIHACEHVHEHVHT